MTATLSRFLPARRPVAFVPDQVSHDTAFARLEIGKALLPPSESDFLPLLQAIDWKCDLIVVDHRGRTSHAETLRSLFDFLSNRGELLWIGTAADERRLFGDLTQPMFRRQSRGECGAMAPHCWLRILNGTQVGLFFARTHVAEAPQRINLALTNPQLLAQNIQRRAVWCDAQTIHDQCDLTADALPGFQAAVGEWQRRQDETKEDWNLRLKRESLHARLDAWQLRIRELRDRDIRRHLHDVPVAKADRTLLRWALNEPRLRIDPALREALTAAEAEYARATAPFYSLSPIQRLGWLIDHDSLLCTKAFPPQGPAAFVPGQRYAIKCSTGHFSKAHSRASLLGEMEAVSHHSQELIVRVRGTGDQPVMHEFADWHGRTLRDAPTTTANQKFRHSMEALAAHFQIPEVKSIVELEPDRYARHVTVLHDIERESAAVCSSRPIVWKAKQIEDLATFCLHPGGVFAWDKGLGKGLALYAIARLHGAKRTLLVAPEGLHEQIRDEWKEKFGFSPRRVMTIDDIDHDPELKAAVLACRGSQPSAITSQPQFWLTSYTALGFNGADEWPDDFDKATGEKLILPQTLKRREAMGVQHGDHDQGIGQSTILRRMEVTCILRPSLATVLRDVFDCVETDEAVRLKSTDSYVSLGVRRMRTAHPIALTGTPVKNRLDDLFWLTKWTGGHRFDFPASAAGKEQFAERFMVTEENHTRAEKYRAEKGSSRKFTRRLPRVSNRHALWRVLGGLVLRRRKEDFGEDIVPKTIKAVRVKAGRAQQEVYRWHLQNPPQLDAKGLPMDPVAALLAQLSYLRTAALCPDSPKLKGSASARSWTDHTPLLHGTFHLIEQALNEGDQVMVASPFTHFSASLEQRLREAGVSCIRLDGETDAARRGVLARQFKKFRYAVLIAGQQAMGEGHSFDQCRRLIVPSLHWAYDVNSQVEDRVHRLTSKRPVTIYALTVENTIAPRLLDLYREKAEGAALAIDGRLFSGPEDGEEVSLGALLREAQASFNVGGDTIDERTLESDWPALAQKLARAEERYREFHPPIVPDITGATATSAEVRAAMDAIAAPAASELAREIQQMPGYILAAVAGTVDPEELAAIRAQFSAFAAAHPHHTDWRLAWQAFHALPAAKRAAFATPSHSDRQTDEEPDFDPAEQRILTALSRLQ